MWDLVPHPRPPALSVQSQPWTTSEVQQVTFETSRTCSDLTDICAQKGVARVTYDFLKRFKDYTCGIKPQNLFCDFALVGYPGKQTESFPPIIFIWVRDSLWASTEFFWGPNDSLERGRLMVFLWISHLATHPPSVLSSLCVHISKNKD